MIISFLSRYYRIPNKDELKKFLILAGIFALTIGVYWLLRPLKDSFFIQLSDGRNIPWAKITSLVVVVPLAMLYSRLVDVFPRHKMFYALCAIYATLGLVFAFLFAHETYGLSNLATFVVDEKLYSHHVTTLGRLIGWAWYVFAESFGSLMVVLFWGFAADTTTPESAKKGFGIVATGGQIGGVAGPLLVSLGADRLGASIVLFMVAATVLIAAMVWYFMSVVPKEQLAGYQVASRGDSAKAAKPKAGFLEGAKLLLTKPYLLCVVAIISIFEIIVTVFDFKFKMLAGQAYQGAQLTTLFAWFGVTANIIALFSLIFGISSIGRRLGVGRSLLLLPVLVAGGVFVMYFNEGLWFAFGTVCGLKALNYALNQPTKEQLYIPTTKETKYKAKAWVEMFGSRGSKGAGSLINLLAKKMRPELFLLISSVAALGLIGVWLFAALYAGKKHKEAIDNDTVVC